MKTKISIITILTFFLLACNFEQKENEIGVDNSTVEKSIDKVPIKFLLWYRQNVDQLNKIQLVNNANGEIWDSTKFYSVNFLNTEKYLKILNSSGLVSEQYLDILRAHFKKSEESLKITPQNDGPAPGFDYDFIMNSQDTEEEFSGIEKAKCSIKKNKNINAEVNVEFSTGTSLTFLLTKENGKWLVANIQ